MLIPYNEINARLSEQDSRNALVWSVHLGLVLRTYLPHSDLASLFVSEVSRCGTQFIYCKQRI